MTLNETEGVTYEDGAEPTGITFTVNNDGSADYKYYYKLPLAERLSVWLKNLPTIPTQLALWWLKQEFRKHPDFRATWHANIAMPIYDTLMSEGVWHQPAIKQANICADRLMRHLFEA